MRTIYSVPPQHSVEIMGFRVVSTCEKEKAGLEGVYFHCGDLYRSDMRCGLSAHTAPVPGLLLLGQSDGENREFKRELMITRCPASPIVEWELEIGMLPDPRVAVEVLPGKTNVTVISIPHRCLRAYLCAHVCCCAVRCGTVRSTLLDA
jgi:hypothetical protein